MKINMDKKLYELMVNILKHPNTIVIYQTEPSILGFCINNKILNLSVDIFSSRSNEAYFRFKVPANYVNGIAYKINNLDEIRPILDLCVDGLDSYPDSPNYKSYIFAFRQFLRGEAIPNGFKIHEEKFIFELHSNEKNVGYIHKEDMEVIKECIDNLNEPTSMFKLWIRGLKDGTGRINLYIPQYSIKEYFLLEPKKTEKCPEAINDFDKVFKHISASNHNNKELTSIFTFIGLTDDLNKDTSDEAIKRKPKI